jgi:hypothetical protein
VDSRDWIGWEPHPDDFQDAFVVIIVMFIEGLWRWPFTSSPQIRRLAVVCFAEMTGVPDLRISLVLRLLLTTLDGYAASHLGDFPS